MTVVLVEIEFESIESDHACYDGDPRTRSKPTRKECGMTALLTDAGHETRIRPSTGRMRLPNKECLGRAEDYDHVRDLSTLP